MLNILNHQGMQNQNNIPFHTHEDGRIKKKEVITSIREDVEELETSYTAGGNVKWHSTLK